MGCAHRIPCPRKPRVTMYETLAIAGYPERPPKRPRRTLSPSEEAVFARALREHNDLVAGQKSHILRADGESWTCGDGLTSDPLCECGHTSELLCDHDVGGGATCDRQVCWCCSVSVGPDRDLCREHAIDAAKRSGGPLLRLVK